jgi:hypothetical protein
MRKILLAVVGAVSIAVAAAPLAAATLGVPSASTVVIDAAGAHHQALVLEPGSRGNVVEI